MSICNSCGGVIGRDCFNPTECAWIGHQMEQDAANRLADERAAQEIEALEHRNAEQAKEIAELKRERDGWKSDAEGAYKALERLGEEQRAILADRDRLTAQLAAAQARLPVDPIKRRNVIGNIDMEDGDADCLAIVLATYFSKHRERPENDAEHEDNHHWGDWVLKKTDEALDRIGDFFTRETKQSTPPAL